MNCIYKNFRKIIHLFVVKTYEKMSAEITNKNFFKNLVGYNDVRHTLFDGKYFKIIFIGGKG